MILIRISPERAKFNSTGHRPVSCIKINYKPCKGDINQVIYFALTGLV